MATVTTSIGGGTSHNHNAAISAVSGSGPYTVTIAANTSVNGDALWDEHATPRKYLITGGGGTTSLTVEDSTGVGAGPDNSGTSSSQITRYYNGSTPITDWESELDDTNLYAASDDAVGECYNDAAFDQRITINGGGTVSLNSITLTVASGERHDGTDGSGARIEASSDGAILLVDNNNRTVDISWIEVKNDVSSALSSAQIIGIRYDQDDQGTVSNCIVHRMPGNTNSSREGTGIRVSGARADVDIVDNFVFNCGGNHGRSGTDVAGGIGIHDVGQSSGEYVANNTAFNCVEDNTATLNGTGIEVNPTGGLVYNNLSLSNEGADYVNSATTFTTNGSSDTTGTSGLQSLTAGDEIVSTGSGTEDLHIKVGATSVDAGTDLATTPTGVNIDIDGRDRDAEGDTWDIGAHEFVASGIATILNTLVIQAVNRASTY